LSDDNSDLLENISPEAEADRLDDFLKELTYDSNFGEISIDKSISGEFEVFSAQAEIDSAVLTKEKAKPQ
jgi:hypothetical protein